MTFFDADGSGQALPQCGTGGRQHKWFRIIYRPCALKLETFSPGLLQKRSGLSSGAFLHRFCLKSFQIGFDGRM
jgi:hypothetical protein